MEYLVLLVPTGTHIYKERFVLTDFCTVRPLSCKPGQHYIDQSIQSMKHDQIGHRPMLVLLPWRPCAPRAGRAVRRSTAHASCRYARASRHAQTSQHHCTGAALVPRRERAPTRGRALHPATRAAGPAALATCGTAAASECGTPTSEQRTYNRRIIAGQHAPVRDVRGTAPVAPSRERRGRRRPPWARQV